eukprot:TRINITY_DN4633_c0_g1_i2.p2 TRINITY_DN4633_c0_g1~~TRINITY_DN4633_c0_g1_i2.p2  ORF type:complete len:317 (+),score=63.87 TRINITY_DN4633_c0_g1_i2:1241-2191(+)
MEYSSSSKRIEEPGFDMFAVIPKIEGESTVILPVIERVDEETAYLHDITDRDLGVIKWMVNFGTMLELSEWVEEICTDAFKDCTTTIVDNVKRVLEQSSDELEDVEELEADDIVSTIEDVESDSVDEDDETDSDSDLDLEVYDTWHHYIHGDEFYKSSIGYSLFYEFAEQVFEESFASKRICSKSFKVVDGQVRLIPCEDEDAVAWASPEELETTQEITKVTNASKVFSLGMILLEMETGAVPWNGLLPSEFDAFQRSEVPFLLLLPDRLYSRGLIERSLNWNPEERPNPQTFLKELQTVIVLTEKLEERLDQVFK